MAEKTDGSWNVEECNDDNMTTYNVTWEDSYEVILECKTLEHANRVAELLNSLEVGPNSNHPKLQDWQQKLLDGR